ncbi:olfactory receptor 4P4-like [Trichosurus vulpecula]|uniref:olfactory receptor 4P4-like n=1 Tax=Trichosurus vulpecula TaxID=9337 RepID=UPI00186AE238|nr:olfactory receptor 4P4-like [Trichosurus vulpecula]
MNHKNNITEFILLGLSRNNQVQILCFVVFLFCYVAILMGNFIVMISIACSQLIEQPMYFFLAYLSIMDVCYTSTVTPKLIRDMLAEKKSISYTNCLIQLFTVHFFGGVEVFILTGMAYDRYVAICKPLHYMAIMSRDRCNALVLAACGGASLHSFAQFLLAALLPFCGPNEINHYFCDMYPLLKLACADTHRFGLLVTANSGVIALMVFIVLMASYAVILYTLRARSSESRQKAHSTCGSHITVVFLFFGPSLFIYIRPPTTFQEDKVLALFYTIIAPMLNPLIYTLKNSEMKNAMKKVWNRILFKGRNQLF